MTSLKKTFSSRASYRTRLASLNINWKRTKIFIIRYSIVTWKNERVVVCYFLSSSRLSQSNAIFFDGLTIWRLKVLTVQSCMVGVLHGSVRLGSTIAFSQKRIRQGRGSTSKNSLLEKQSIFVSSKISILETWWWQVPFYHSLAF